MKNCFYIPIILIAVTLFNRCSKDFIEIDKPSGKSAQTLFASSQDVEKALTGCYHTLWQMGLYKRSQILLGDCPSDNIKENGDAGSYGIGTLQLNTFIFNNDNFLIDERWKDIYQGLFRINTFLENVNNPGFNLKDLNPSIKNRWIAEAKFLRALCNFLLVTNFGNAPLITKPLTPEEAFEIKKNTELEFWAQIELDLGEAIPVLPPSYDNANIGRVTKGAANALLGRAYLYQSKWQSCIGSTKSVIESGLYDLYKGNYADLFNGKAENTIESVFELQSINLGKHFADLTDFGLMTYYWSPNFQWAENFFGPSKSLIDAFAARPQDLRRVGSIYLVGANDLIDADGNGTSSIFPSAEDFNRKNYINGGNVRKFLPTGINQTNRNLFKINFCIIRYAEVLLNYAEALNENGQSTQALIYVNYIRKRAGMPDLNIANQSQLREAIALERRLELCFEGHRYFDLKRTGKAKDVLGSYGYVEANNKFFPIPLSETSINKNL